MGVRGTELSVELLLPDSGGVTELGWPGGSQVAASVQGGRARPYDGTGLCFLEMGDGEVGRVDVHFRAEGGPTAPLLGPSQEYSAEKAEFGAVRRARWFDL